MNSNELYQKYLEAEKERFELENKIESYVEKWKNGETVLSNQTIQQAMEKGYERLEELKRTEAQLHNEYIQQEQKEEAKRGADISLQHNLGIRPDNMNIVGGVLSSNASESHLIAESKSPEQLELERQQLLANVKLKVQSGEISLADASKLVNDVNTSYEFYSSEEKSGGMRR
ncbi:MAG TPA: hypothetical protein PLV83_02360 [Bacilli bacterium]|nr:hypothetical protein [Bacilli bacterium]